MNELLSITYVCVAQKGPSKVLCTGKCLDDVCGMKTFQVLTPQLLETLFNCYQFLMTFFSQCFVARAAQKLHRAISPCDDVL